MFEILLFSLLVLAVSYGLYWMVMKRDLGPFNAVVNVLGFIGVVIHEVAHYLMCKLVGVKTRDISVKLTYQGRVVPHGHVGLREMGEVSFMQSVMISLAPLMVSTWLFVWTLDLILNTSFPFLFRIFGGLFCISLLLGATPSAVDFAYIPRSYNRDPRYSAYQIYLVLLAGISAWLLFVNYQLVHLDFWYYVCVFCFYFLLKYSFKGVKRLFGVFGSLSRRSFDLRAFTRNKIHLQEHHPLGIKEVEW